MTHLETINGKGTATAPDGRTQTVAYTFDVYQDEIEAATLTNPHARIPGLKRIQGHVSPPCFFGQNGVVLQMQDGRKMKFVVIDMQGRIAFSGWDE